MPLFEIHRLVISTGETYPVILNTDCVEKIIDTTNDHQQKHKAGTRIIYKAKGPDPEIFYTVESYDDVARIVGVKPQLPKRKRDAKSDD